MKNIENVQKRVIAKRVEEKLNKLIEDTSPADQMAGAERMWEDFTTDKELIANDTVEAYFGGGSVRIYIDDGKMAPGARALKALSAHTIIKYGVDFGSLMGIMISISGKEGVKAFADDIATRMDKEVH